LLLFPRGETPSFGGFENPKPTPSETPQPKPPVTQCGREPNTDDRPAVDNDEDEDDQHVFDSLLS